MKYLVADEAHYNSGIGQHGYISWIFIKRGVTYFNTLVSVGWRISGNEGLSNCLLKALGATMLSVSLVINYLIFNPLIVLSSLILFIAVSKWLQMRLDLTIVVSARTFLIFAALSDSQPLWNKCFLHCCRSGSCMFLLHSASPPAAQNPWPPSVSGHERRWDVKKSFREPCRKP